MAHRVLLVSINRCAVPDPVFPLGLAHLSGALKRAGHETRWFDVMAARESFTEALSEFGPTCVGISIRNIDDVLIRKRETFYDSLDELCRAVAERVRCPVVLGGSGFSIFPRELLGYSGARFGILGAGEGPFVALLQALDSGRLEALANVPGLVYFENGRLKLNPVSPESAHHTGVGFGRSTSDLQLSTPSPVDELDFPQEVVSHYLANGAMLNIQTQRGCACHCCYCTYPVIEGRAHRRRPAEAVADEFARAQKLGARYAFVVDSVFNSSPRHVSEVCEAILRRGIKLPWGCFLRPQGLTPDLMKLMARAGLSHIEFGSDSFCDEVLAAYQKGFAFEEVLQSSDLARREKVDYCHFLISGGPGETRDTLEQGFENSRRLNGAVVMAVVGMRIYPGTPLWTRAITEGVLPPNANLLKPVYYVAPGLAESTVFARLEEFAKAAPNWIVGDPNPEYARLVAKLRQRGVVGPLWSYLSILQRFWPAGTGELPGHAPVRPHQ